MAKGTLRGRRRGGIGKSPRLMQLLRGLRKRAESREQDSEPVAACQAAVVTGSVVYCTDRRVRASVGGAAVRCVGKRCGVCELPPGYEESEP